MSAATKSYAKKLFHQGMPLCLNTGLKTEVAFPMDACCIFVLIFHRSPGYDFDCIDFGDRQGTHQALQFYILIACNRMMRWE